LNADVETDECRKHSVNDSGSQFSAKKFCENRITLHQIPWQITVNDAVTQ